MKAIFPITLTAIALAVTGCNATGDGRGTVTLDINSANSGSLAANALPRGVSALALDMTNSSVAVTDTSGATVGNLTLNQAWVVVKEIELEHEDDYLDDSVIEDDASEKIEFVGPFVIDILTGQTYPPIPAVTIDTGFYTDIEMDIEKLAPEDVAGIVDLPVDVGTNMLDYSLYLSGTYDSLDTVTYPDSIPFTLSYDQTDEFEFSGTDLTNGFVVDESGINDVIVAFRLNEWFRFDDPETNSTNLAFEDAIVDNGSGDEINLDGNTNSNIMDVIEDNIEDSAEYGEDDDDDGELDNDEDDDDSNDDILG